MDSLTAGLKQSITYYEGCVKDVEWYQQDTVTYYG